MRKPFPLRFRTFVSRRRKAPAAGANGTTHLRWKFLRRSAAFGGAIRTTERYVRSDLHCGVDGCPTCSELPRLVKPPLHVKSISAKFSYDFAIQGLRNTAECNAITFPDSRRRHPCVCKPRVSQFLSILPCWLLTSFCSCNKSVHGAIGRACICGNRHGIASNSGERSRCLRVVLKEYLLCVSAIVDCPYA